MYVTSLKDTCCSVIVVGAGPGGIVCSLELAAKGMRVTLLESGSRRLDVTTQELSKAEQLDPKRHASMEIATRRQMGGASVIWGGRCVPYDPIDFDKRDFIPHSKWPIGFEEIERYHDKAAAYCRCGSAEFSTNSITTIKQKTITPDLVDGDVKSSDLERWSLPTDFGKEYHKQLAASENIQVALGHTVVQILVGSTNGDITGLLVYRQDGTHIVLRADAYVIACGGVESTRLLLQPCDHFPNGLGNKSDWLGRCYMGHLSGQIAEVQFSGDPKKTQFGFLRDKDGVYLRQRFTLSREAQHRERVTNCAMWLVNPKLGDPSHRNGVLSFAYLALSSRFGKYFASEAIRQSAISDSVPNSNWQHIRNLAFDCINTGVFIPTFGVKRFLLHRRVPGFFQYSSSNCYPLHYHAEQVPQRESRIRLGNTKDRFGLFRVKIDLVFCEQDIHSVLTSHSILDRYLRELKAGKLRYYKEDSYEDCLRQAKDGFHQVGTTRMSLDAADGVVDVNCRVHGTDRLYVLSSSNFVTSGQANSTFQIVAFGIRLAEHICNVLKAKRL